MLDRPEAGHFSILCLDTDAARALGECRISWMAVDLIESRPALSRWHPDRDTAVKVTLADL